jgi:alpha-D-ribose 1-methylphosphonate 5-triphosphate synthase subunit PhnH
VSALADDPATLEGAFADPPAEAARAFRALLDAMARPGRVHRLAGAAPPAPLPPAAGVAALTLCDAETPIWLAPELRTPAVEGWLRFHANCPFAERPEGAAFAFGSPEALAEVLERLPEGEADWPDRSATLVVLAPTLSEGPALRLSGPGVDGTARLPLGPALDAVAALHAPNRRSFPLGRDLILCAGDAVAALPRSTRLEPEG